MQPRLPPGPPYPAALASLGWHHRPEPFLLRCRARYGDMFTLPLIPDGPWVVVHHPDLVKQVFTGDPRLLHAGEGNQILRPLVGRNGLLLLDEARHMQQRKLLLPPFHGDRMHRYLDVMREATERSMDRWPAGRPFELFPHMQALTLDVLLRTLIGLGDGARLDRLRQLMVEVLGQVTNPVTWLVFGVLGPRRAARFRPWLRKRAPLDAMLLEEIALRRAAPDLEEREDVLSMLVQARDEDGTPMTDLELRDQTLTLLASGLETTATSLSWAIERLVRDPARLARLAEGDDAYAEAVVKETLRLRPPIPINLRKLVEPMPLGDYLLPAGMTVATCGWLVHRRPEIYPEPHAFRPERFLDQSPGTYTWLPFGGGVRRCPAAPFAQYEMKVVLQAIARRLRLEPADPVPERTKRRAIILAPERGAEVVLAA